VKKYGKEYTVEEVAHRFTTFRANAAKIAAHDASVGHSLAINEFADLTEEEFSKMYMGVIPRQAEYARSLNLHVNSGKPAAASIDWTTKGAVTPIKNQAQCGSCWAFSTTGGIEGAVAVKTGKLVSLSEQALVDCGGSEGNLGCGGGLMDHGFEYVIKSGLPAEDAYPYTAKDGTCHSFTSVTKISSYKDVARGSESDLMDALQIGPVSIAVDAGQFQLYSGGILTVSCGKALDHGVLLVGYGEDNGQKYWKIKNSWGAAWGEEGYIRVIYGSDECGLADSASYPIV